MITKIFGVIFLMLTGLSLLFGIGIVSPQVMGVIALCWGISWLANA